MEYLYFQKKTGRHYLVITDVEHIFCIRCRKIIEVGRTVMIHRSYSRTRAIKRYWCMDCIKYHRKMVYDDFKAAMVSFIVPDNSLLVPDLLPALKVARNTDVFRMADTVTKDGEEVVDRCRVSNDPNRNIMPEYDRTQAELKKRKDSDKTLLLDELKEWKPAEK